MKSDRDERLTPARRVKSRRDFLRIQSQGRKLRAPHFLVSVAALEEREDRALVEPRIGVTITTKVDKRAARRNRLRRRVREIFRRNRQNLRRPVEIVVIALSGATELSFEEIRDEILGTLERGRLLYSPKKSR